METAINEKKAFIDTGSFWNTQLTKKSLEDAKNVCALSLYSTVLNYIDNCIHNLKSNGKQKVINKTIFFDKSTIVEVSDNVYTIAYSDDIDITNIVANMEDGSVVKLKKPDFKIIRGSNIVFTNIQFNTINPNNIKDSKFIVDGTIEPYSDKYRSLLSSLINISFVPCDERAKSIASYIGGSKQSPYDFYRAINFISNCFEVGINRAKITASAMSDNESVYVFSNGDSRSKIEYPYSDGDRKLTQFTSIDGKGNNTSKVFDADNILNPAIEVQYPGAYNVSALGENTSNPINVDILNIAYKVGSPILIICYDSRILSKESIKSMHNIISHIYPIGYTINQYVKYVSKSNVLSYELYEDWIIE